MLTTLPSLRPIQTGNGLRLRTLILIRWLSLAGQFAAVVVAVRHFGFDLPFGQCLLVIGVSAIANLVLHFGWPETHRLTETEALMLLLLDLTQLSFLLYFTGGMSNPFALHLLSPVVISASALQLRITVFLAVVAISFSTLLMMVHQPLRFASGQVFAVPPVFEFGFWLSIMIGILFLGYYAYRVATEMRTLSQALVATQLALAREQKLTDLAGVVAATAHELGTPLATIKLVSSELMDELADRADLHDDAALIRDQADRCRDILRSMGRAGKDDQLMRRAPLSALLQEAAEPHLQRGKSVRIEVAPDAGAPAAQPVVLRRPEIVHGLRNLIQNAVDFARSEVRVAATWTADRITLSIADDGPGFPVNVLTRIGDPFLRDRRAILTDPFGRPEYEGMGLGLFIAKTLLERTGAQLSFDNAGMSAAESGGPARPRGQGAIVVAAWFRADLEPPLQAALGQNPAHSP